MRIFLSLSYFDQIYGPRIYKVVPEDMSMSCSKKILDFINVKIDESIIETILPLEKVKCINLPFSIPSQWARGRKLDLLLTITIEKNFKSEPLQGVIRKAAQEFKKSPNLYKAFYKSEKAYAQDPEIPAIEKQIEDILINILHDIKKALQHPEIGTFLILGLSLVGKTTMIDTLKSNIYNPNIKPTLTFNIIELIIENYIIKTVDVSGQKRMRDEWWTYAKNPDALIFVIDITDSQERLKESKIELEKILEHYAQDHQYQLSEKVPLLICFNKIDLVEDVLKKERIICNFLDLENFKINFKVQLTSALTGKGLNEGFNWLISELLKLE